MKLPLLLLSLSLATAMHAQEKIFEEPIGWEGKNIELHTISDHDKQEECLFLCKEDSIRAFVLDSRQAVIRQFYFRRLKEERFLGGFIKGGKVYVFLQHRSGSQDLHVWVLSIDEGVGRDHTVPFAMRHERAVEQISCGDHFLYFAVNKRQSAFSIYDFFENDRCDTLTYTFEDKIWQQLTTFNGGWSTDMDVVKVDADEQMNPDLAHIPNKLYWMRDSLFLLMNGYEKGVTAIFSFDLRSKKVTFRKIYHNAVLRMDPPPLGYADNSMLFGDKLYFVSAQDDQLDVQVRDFYRGWLLKEFTAAKGGEIPFTNTPIIQEGSYFHAGPRELTRTRQLIRKMVNGEAVLTVVREDSGRIGLTIGAWKKEETGSIVAGIGAPSLGVFVSTGMFFRSGWVKSSRFKMLVDTATLEHVPGEITADLGDRIEQYTKGVSIPPEGECLFRNGGRFVYACYNRDEKKVVIMGF